MAIIVGVTAALGLTGLTPPQPWITYNATASAPVGFYRLASTKGLRTGDQVLSRLPPDIAQFADYRRYVPSGVPVLKTIAAPPGATVCRRGATIFVNGAPVAEALKYDRARRPLAVWHGCRTLQGDQVFLLSTHSRASFDGRYFGPTSANLIVAKAFPLWTW